jgi:hypothetical protein
MNELTRAEADELQLHEAVIEGGLRTFIEVGTALLSIRDGRLYRATHSTFEGYCRDRWGMTRQHANRLVKSAEVVINLEPIGSIPETESQARPLSSLGADQQRQAWSLAVESAPDGKPTAKQVEEAVREVTGKSKEEPPSDADSELETARREALDAFDGLLREIQAKHDSGAYARTLGNAMEAGHTIQLGWRLFCRLKGSERPVEEYAATFGRHESGALVCWRYARGTLSGAHVILELILPPPGPGHETVLDRIRMWPGPNESPV